MNLHQKYNQTVQSWVDIYSKQQHLREFTCQLPLAEPNAYYHSRYFAEMNADPIFGRFLPHNYKIACYFSAKNREQAHKQTFGWSKL